MEKFKTANLRNNWRDPRVNNRKHRGFSGLLELCLQPIRLWSPVPTVKTVKKNSSHCNIFSRCNPSCKCGKILRNFTQRCFCEFFVLYLVQEKMNVSACPPMGCIDPHPENCMIISMSLISASTRMYKDWYEGKYSNGENSPIFCTVSGYHIIHTDSCYIGCFINEWIS